MLSGEHLFENVLEVYKYKEEKTFVKVDKVIDDTNLATLVKKMLAKEPKERPSVEEVLGFFKVEN